MPEEGFWWNRNIATMFFICALVFSHAIKGFHYAIKIYNKNSGTINKWISHLNFMFPFLGMHIDVTIYFYVNIKALNYFCRLNVLFIINISLFILFWDNGLKLLKKKFDIGIWNQNIYNYIVVILLWKLWCRS